MAKKWSQLSRAERHARARRLAANPATRASIPTEHLRGFAGADKLRAQRALNQRLDSPFVPGGQLTNRQAARERNAATGLKYGDAERQLGTQVADSQRFETQQLPAWFADYQRILGDARKQAEANTTLAVGQVNALGGDLAAASTLRQGEINKDMTADAAARGATYDAQTATDVAERASAARRALTSGFGAMLATQGAADRQRLIDAVPTSQLRLGEEQAAERGRRRKLTDDQLALAREKGDFQTSFMADLRDRENKGALERAVFGAETEQAEAKLEADVAKERNDVNQWGYTNSEWRKLSPARRQKIIAEQKKAGRAPAKPGEPKYGVDAADWAKMSPEQRRRAKAQWDKAGKSGPSAGKPAKEPASSLGPRRAINTRATTFLPEYARDRGIKLRGLSPAGRAKLVSQMRRTHPGLFGGANEKFLSASLDLAILGRITSPNLRWLRDNGVFVTSQGQYWAQGAG